MTPIPTITGEGAAVVVFLRRGAYNFHMADVTNELIFGVLTQIQEDVAELKQARQELREGIETELRSVRGDDLFIRGRHGTRARVVAAGLSDADIDALIEEAREDVAHGRA